MNEFQIGATAGLYDPFKATRTRLLGDKKFGFLYGSHRDIGVDRSPSPDLVDGTDLLELNGLHVDFKGLHVPKNYFRQNVRHDLSKLDVILNLVTNPDTNDVILRNIERMLKGFKGRVINHPAKVMQTRRDIVSRKLSGLPWLDVPECVRLKVTTAQAANDAIARAGITFPAIVRSAGTHKGKCHLAKRLNNITVEKGVTVYLTSFRDYVSPDGYYRKARFWFIGDTIILRHLAISDNWNVHAEAIDRIMQFHPEFLEEERSLMQLHSEAIPEPLLSRLKEIKKRVGLDFFGLDCSLLPDGRILFFEANASMHFMRSRSDVAWRRYSAKSVTQAEEAFNALLRDDRKS
jgi:hypothetical protein